MEAKKRKRHSTVEQRLFEEFYRFSFFKATNLIESLNPDKTRLGTTLNPEDEPVRFKVKPGFMFPPSDISGLSRKDESAPVDMEISFMGLVGPNRVLPNWYNQMALERMREKDYTMIEFFNLFHHRLISLFYLAWKKYRFPENYIEGARDRLSRHLLSLIGLGTKGLSGRIGLAEESLTFYAGLLSRPVASAVAIEATVEYLSGTKAKVEQFINRMLPLSKEDQTSIGTANSSLGEDAVCGSYVWECQTKFRVNLGPMGYDDFLRFLPSGDMLKPIFSLIKYMVGIEYEFEVRIYLKKEEVPPCELGAENSSASRLGWSAWSKHPEFMHSSDPYITFYDPEPIA